MSASDTFRAIEAVWRIEAARLIAGLARVTRDIGLAEELAQDALEAALKQWPDEGVPRNPGAWLMQVAKHRGLDALRRQKLLARKHEEIGHELETEGLAAPDLDSALDDEVGDDLLRLIFTACHPVLSTEARLALTLRLLGGLTTEEIARAFLVPEPTMAQRLVRAKKTLSDATVPFEVPHGAELAARLASVLEVVYLIFNEGYSATAGQDWVRPALCEEAMRLGRILAARAPLEPEVHGLLALMELQASRLRARTGPKGEPILLLNQDRGRWDHLLIRRGLAGLARARALSQGPGPYVLQAELAACHARADGRRNRLEPDRRALRATRRNLAVARDRAESGRGGVDGAGAGRGAGSRRVPGGRACAEALPPAAERAWRSAGEAGASRRGGGGLRARGGADEK